MIRLRYDTIAIRLRYDYDAILNAQEETENFDEVTEGIAVPYGTYHQLYRVDGKLVAVGVVDILPKCLVSLRCY